MRKSVESRFNRIIIKLFTDVVSMYLFNLSKLKFYLNVLKYQKTAVKKRNIIIKDGNSAPAIMIFSITNRCNLKCAGCYNHAQKRNVEDKLSLQRISNLFNEAREQGIGIVMIAGGEPFMRMDILNITSDYPEMIFPVFTNGTLIESNINFLKKNPHVFPILSLEGDEKMTNKRRGDGLYENIIRSADLLKKNKIVFGVSLTLTRENADKILANDFINGVIKLGAKVVFFVEYVPQNTLELDLCLTDNQKQRLINIRRKFEKKYSALFISLPGDEEYFGGCLAAGRGFIHVSAGGDVEPCPFAPYSTANINSVTLKEALSTSFIKKIRDSHHLLTEAKGGCILWENREWVERQLLEYKN